MHEEEAVDLMPEFGNGPADDPNAPTWREEGEHK